MCNNPDDHNPAGGGYRVNQSAPVGSYPKGASPYGCMDMVGNAWEWVASRSKSHPGNPAPYDHGEAYRLVKGGCWDDGPPPASAAATGRGISRSAAAGRARATPTTSASAWRARVLHHTRKAPNESVRSGTGIQNLRARRGPDRSDAAGGLRDGELLFQAQAAAFRLYHHQPLIVAIDHYSLAPEACGGVVTQPDGHGVPAITEPLLPSAADLLRLRRIDPSRDGRFPMVLDVAST